METTAPPIPRRARYGSKIYEVLHYAGNNCFVLLDRDGVRLTVPRRRLVFIK
jgi:hypothetical protein